MTEERYRIHSHMTRSSFLHVEHALEIGKVRLFAGQYKRGEGAKVTAYHYLDVADVRVLLNDLAWGKGVDFIEYKGTDNREGPKSRVLKVKRNGEKVWVRLENGPGQTIGEGAVKPAGDPDAVVNVPLSVWDARKLAHAILAYVQAWEVITFRSRTQGTQ
jgi:hypothetical protein